jgi:hypothetical protein
LALMGQDFQPSSRKNPFRAAISSGRVVTAGPVEAIFTSSTAFTSGSGERKYLSEASNPSISAVIDLAATTTGTCA